MIQREPMTAGGKVKLEEELKHLLEVERPSVIKAIEEARAQGDLSENAEYDAAKEKQGFIEMRIRDLKDKISRAEVIDPSTIKSSRVTFGATVKLEDENEKVLKETSKFLKENGRWVYSESESIVHPQKVSASSKKPFVRKQTKVGRNEPCPCGSGKKFKKCCGR